MTLSLYQPLSITYNYPVLERPLLQTEGGGKEGDSGTG
jgi:hypothetical protein